MSENLANLFGDLPANLSQHLKITVIPLVLGVSVSLPLAILLVRRKGLRYPVLTAVGIIQTIPSLALLALMIPLLVVVSWICQRLVGTDIKVLGFYPTIIALTLYSILPILRNTVAGILGVDPALTEAARGVGMTERQALLKVELPLAAPVILAGIRTATVWVVGTATLATPVMQRSLGNYIFSGLQTRNWLAVAFGCVAAAALAILLDTLLGTLEKAIAERRRRLALASVVALSLIFGAGLVTTALDFYREYTGRFTASIGSKTFTEQYILSHLIQDELRDGGIPAERAVNLGSTIGFDALANDEIDIFVDYSGTIWANYMRRDRSADRETVLRQVTEWLEQEHGIRSLGSLGFENAYALAMRREQAERLGIESIADLAEYAPRLSIGGDYEFFERPEWGAILRAYGLDFGREESSDSTFMYEAIARGEVDVISAFTTDGRIDAYDLVLLDDPEQAIPPYDAMLLLSPRASARPEISEALRPLIGAIDNATMRSINGMVDRSVEKVLPHAAARALRRKIEGESEDLDPEGLGSFPSMNSGAPAPLGS